MPEQMLELVRKDVFFPLSPLRSPAPTSGNGHPCDPTRVMLAEARALVDVSIGFWLGAVTFLGPGPGDATNSFKG